MKDGKDNPAADRDTLDALETRIRAARAGLDPKPRAKNEKYEGLSLAWRMTLELAIGIGIGFWIGWALDSLIGTRPFLMIVFGMFGFAAGMKTALRTAKEVNGGDAPQGKEEADSGER